MMPQKILSGYRRARSFKAVTTSRLMSTSGWNTIGETVMPTSKVSTTASQSPHKIRLLAGPEHLAVTKHDMHVKQILWI